MPLTASAIARVKRDVAVFAVVTAGIATALITAPTVHAAYGPPINLSSIGGNARLAQIAIAPDGAATAVWMRQDAVSGDNLIWAATRPAGSSTWGPETSISLPDLVTGGSAANPQIAIGRDGTTIVVWLRSNGTNDIIQAAVRPANSATFGTPADISATGATAADPQIAIAPDGTATAVWRRNGVIQAATRAPNASGFTMLPDLSASGQAASEPQLAIGADGATVVVWKRSNGTNIVIQAAARAATDASFSALPDLSSDASGADDPQIAAGPDGTMTAVWVHGPSSQSVIQSATRAPGAASFGATATLSPSDGVAIQPQIAIGPDGTATAVWTYRLGTNRRVVQTTTRPPGGAAFSPTVLDVSGAGAAAGAEEPQVAVGRGGATTIVWTRDSADEVVQATSRGAGLVDFATPVSLSTEPRDADQPQVALDANGAATVVWRRDDPVIQTTSSGPADARLHVATTGNGEVTSSPVGIACGATCTTTVPLGSTVTLMATPGAASSFSTWGGACAGTASTCVLEITGGTSVTAAFTAAAAASTTSTGTLNVISARASGNNGVIVRVRVNQAGRIAIVGTHRHGRACTVRRTVKRGGTYVMVCPLTAATRTRLAARPLRITLRTTYVTAANETLRATRIVRFARFTPYVPPVTG